MWNTTEIKPINNADILCYAWFEDGPIYFHGIYVEESNEIEYEIYDGGRCSLTMIDKWMYIPDPNE